jgi:hypothetical protein
MYVTNAVTEIFAAEFCNSLQLADGFMSSNPNAPVRVTNLGVLQQGGQYADVPVISQISSLVTKQDYTSTAAVDALKLSSRNDKGILLKAKVGPFAYAPNAIKISRMTESDILVNFATQAAQQVRDYIQSAVIYAIKGAVDHMTASAHTKTVWNAAARTNLSPSLLAATRALMGHKNNEIGMWLARSECLFTDLLQSALGAGVTGIADRAANQGLPATLGLPYAVVDHPALTAADGGFDKYYTLGLGAGCCNVDIGGIEFYAPMDVTNTETVRRILRGDVSFAINIPGFTWDSNNGGANPACDGNGIGLNTNWDVTYANAGEVRIVCAEHNYSGN